MTATLQPLPRCCPSHDDWQTLTDHLCRDFPTVDAEVVLRAVLEAQGVTHSFNVADDPIGTVELMVRYRLLLSTGEIADAARTDPQTHHVSTSAARATDGESDEPLQVC
ncbi:MAG TPA: hypothetical protein VHB18_08185 [Mycobacteriales bacterium]|nr:hypothetical protein [Mycobacteriales bacterium]